MFDSHRPREVCYEQRGRYWLHSDAELQEEALFFPWLQWHDQKTSSGKPMPSVIAFRSEGCMKVDSTIYCEYFKDNKGCQ